MPVHVSGLHSSVIEAPWLDLDQELLTSSQSNYEVDQVAPRLASVPVSDPDAFVVPASNAIRSIKHLAELQFVGTSVLDSFVADIVASWRVDSSLEVLEAHFAKSLL